MADEKTQERKKPRTYVHEERYVLVIDGQRKVSFVDHGAAVAEANRIRTAYPRVNIAIHDQQNDSVSALRDDAQEANPAPLPD
jgi:hypothetical protein